MFSQYFLSDLFWPNPGDIREPERRKTRVVRYVGRASATHRIASGSGRPIVEGAQHGITEVFWRSRRVSRRRLLVRTRVIAQGRLLL
jgi:hypothetical protein